MCASVRQKSIQRSAALSAVQTMYTRSRWNLRRRDPPRKGVPFLVSFGTGQTLTVCSPGSRLLPRWAEVRALRRDESEEAGDEPERARRCGACAMGGISGVSPLLGWCFLRSTARSSEVCNWGWYLRWFSSDKNSNPKPSDSAISQ